MKRVGLRKFGVFFLADAIFALSRIYLNDIRSADKQFAGMLCVLSYRPRAFSMSLFKMHSGVAMFSKLYAIYGKTMSSEKDLSNILKTEIGSFGACKFFC